jgi:hypothetical protein
MAQEAVDFSDIEGEGRVRSTPRFIGSLVLMFAGEGIAAIPILDPLLNGNPAGALPGLRIAAGIATFGAGVYALTHLEREPTQEQLEEFYQPQLPLE